MTQVWVVRYDRGLYVFSNLDAVEASVKEMYKGLEVEQEKSDQHAKFLVMEHGRPQDTIEANQFDVHDNATVIHQTDYDAPTVPKKPRDPEF